VQGKLSGSCLADRMLWITGLAGGPGQIGQPGGVGPPGDTGAPGFAGALGAVGPQGFAGQPGVDGVVGQPGAQGRPGPTGPNGKQTSFFRVLFFPVCVDAYTCIVISMWLGARYKELYIP